MTLVAYGFNEHDVIHEFSISKATRYFNEIMEQKRIDRYNDAILSYEVARATQVIPDLKNPNKFYKEQGKNWKKYLDEIHPFKKTKKNVKDSIKGLLNHPTIGKKIPQVVEPAPKPKESDSD